MEFSYTAVKQADGRFSATLQADGKTIDTTTGLRSDKSTKSWAEQSALSFKRASIAPPIHGEQHTVFGEFEL